MWYVMQVYTGKEEETRTYCESVLPKGLLKDCFCPLAEKVHKVNGERKIVKRPLFPGYLFFITEEIEQLYQSLHKIPQLTKVLKVGDDIVPLTKEEQEFIEKRENKEHVFEMSRGYMVGNKVMVLEGAMAGFCGELKHIDRHNRFAVMEVEMFGRKIEATFGLELLKNEEEWKASEENRRKG